MIVDVAPHRDVDGLGVHYLAEHVVSAITLSHQLRAADGATRGRM
jgi:hypothetical protein